MAQKDMKFLVPLLLLTVGSVAARANTPGKSFTVQCDLKAGGPEAAGAHFFTIELGSNNSARVFDFSGNQWIQSLYTGDVIYLVIPNSDGATRLSADGTKEQRWIDRRVGQYYHGRWQPGVKYPSPSYGHCAEVAFKKPGKL